MRAQAVLLVLAVLVLQSSCRRKRHHGHRRNAHVEKGRSRDGFESRQEFKLTRWKTGRITEEPATKRSKYSQEFLDQYEPRRKPATSEYQNEFINNYATENTPLFWKDIEEGKQVKKGEEEDTPPFGMQQDELPSTVGPNENIYGGFPINDVLGGFELPSPETLTILKQVLKQHGPRNEYEAKVHHDLENWAYGYEHHAMPEYDIKETPPFYVAMLEGLKMLQQNKKKPGCQEDKTACGPMIQLTDDQCNTLAGNCPPSMPITSEGFEKPCPWKIIQMLYGCKQPSPPASDEGKPDEAPPPPKPDGPEAKLDKPVEAKPEKPSESKPEKPEEKPDKKPEEKPAEKQDKKAEKEDDKKPDKPEKDKPDEKPKPIPITFNKNAEKLAPDIKDDDGSEANEAEKSTSKLQAQLAIVGEALNKQGSALQEPQSRTDQVAAGQNTTTAATENKPENTNQGISIEIANGQTPAVMESELTAKAKPATAPLKTEFSVWTDWSGCSVTCGKGSLSRTRRCLNWKCDGKVIDLKPCFASVCPDYLNWGEWSQCDSKCGKGRAVRTRQCSGQRCSGISSQERTCFRDLCKSSPNQKPIISSRLINAVGAPWADWSPCTSKCGFGVQIRKRDCKKGNCKINTDLVQTKTCLKPPCLNAASSEMPKRVQQACLYIHNSYRLPHGSEELKWSGFLAKAATKLAKDLSQKSVTNQQLKPYEAPGTSVMVMPNGDSSDIGQEAACITAAKGWYDEQKNYKFDQPNLTEKNRHFTQMIWKASRNIGLGTAQASDGKFYFVAMYDPPGNQDTYVGFRKNALPLQVKSSNEDHTVIVKRLK